MRILFSIVIIAFIALMASTKSPKYTLQVDQNPWTVDVSNWEVDENSAEIINNHVGDEPSHCGPDPESYGRVITENVLPCNKIGKSKPFVLTENRYPQDGIKMFPLWNGMVLQENGWISNPDKDHHGIVYDTITNELWEFYQPRPLDSTYTKWYIEGDGYWNLNNYKRRNECFTSADAAGLSIYPSLIKLKELDAGVIVHAMRMTVIRTLQNYVNPATHASTTGPYAGKFLPMGARLRLRESFSEDGFPDDVKIIIRALKKYGVIIADNGTNFAITGELNPGFRKYERDPLYINLSDRKKEGRWVLAKDFEVLKLRQKLSCLELNKVPCQPKSIDSCIMCMEFKKRRTDCDK